MKRCVKKMFGAGAARSGVSARLLLALALASTVFSHGCFEEERGAVFYGRVVVPQAREFRWSDGGLPRVFDPAVAASPPDTDAVRAIFEGLTDYDPQTLGPVPAVAQRWESGEGGRVWTFHLRHDARWTNGDPVTAQDFVRSWKRSLQLGGRAPHSGLLMNIEGARAGAGIGGGTTYAPDAPAGVQGAGETNAPPAPSPIPFGAAAVDERTLKVRLTRPDANFPSLVSHPVFRPVHELGAHADILTPAQGEAESDGVPEETMISNGAFRISMRAGAGVVLEKAETYWDSARIGLERVHFVETENAEEALAAYRAGEVDAVTNAAFEPLALKLLAPYKDFRRGAYAALTFYQFNASREPFSDIRVREALALALDLERLSADVMGGATIPARRFLPVPGGAGEDGERASEAAGDVNLISYDPARAKNLLAEAGFPGGKNFPAVRLLVNRNDQQRILANAVAAMWQSALGIDAEVILKNWDEYEAALASGDYDIARRSVVMQTLDEETNMRAMFGGGEGVASADDGPPAEGQTGEQTESQQGGGPAAVGVDETRGRVTLSERDALRELPAIPIYFAASFSLVKPYVEGFHTNLLDAPSLKHVRVDPSWTPPPAEGGAGVGGL